MNILCKKLSDIEFLIRDGTHGIENPFDYS